MNELEALRLENTRLTDQLTATQSFNRKYAHRNDEIQKRLTRIEVLHEIVKIKVEATTRLLQSETLAEDQKAVYEASLIAYTDLDTLLEKALYSDVDLLHFAIDNATD